MNNQELLDYAMKMLHRGDSIYSIDSFLKYKNTSTVDREKILDQVSQESYRIRRSNRAIENKVYKQELLKQSYKQLLIGLVVLIISIVLYFEGLAVGWIFFLPLIGMFVGGFLCLIAIIKIITILFFRKD